MLNKKNYENETINKKMLVMVSIIYLLFLFFIIILIIEGTIEGLIAFIIVFIIMLICLPLAYLQKRIFVNKRNLILKIGKKVIGKIIDIKIHYDSSENPDGLNHVRKKTRYVIEYINNDKIEHFTTPVVIFSNSDIVDNEVTVYISEIGIYVDDFKLRKKQSDFIAMRWLKSERVMLLLGEIITTIIRIVVLLFSIYEKSKILTPDLQHNWRNNKIC